MRKIVQAAVIGACFMLCLSTIGEGRTFSTAKGIFKNASIKMDLYGTEAGFTIVIDKPKRIEIPIEWKELSPLDRDIFLLRPISYYKDGKRYYHDMCQIWGIGQYYLVFKVYDLKDPKYRGKLGIIMVEIKDLDNHIKKEIGRI